MLATWRCFVSGTNGGKNVGAGTGNAGLTEGKERGGAAGDTGFWRRYHDTDDASDGFGRDQVGAVMPRRERDRDERRDAVSPWKTRESAAGGLEAARQVLLLSRRQATPRRPAAPCKYPLACPPSVRLRMAEHRPRPSLLILCWDYPRRGRYEQVWANECARVIFPPAEFDSADESLRTRASNDVLDVLPRRDG